MKNSELVTLAKKDLYPRELKEAWADQTHDNNPIGFAMNECGISNKMLYLLVLSLIAFIIILPIDTIEIRNRSLGPFELIVTILSISGIVSGSAALLLVCKNGKSAFGMALDKLCGRLEISWLELCTLPTEVLKEKAEQVLMGYAQRTKYLERNRPELVDDIYSHKKTYGDAHAFFLKFKLCEEKWDKYWKTKSLEMGDIA